MIDVKNEPANVVVIGDTVKIAEDTDRVNRRLYEAHNQRGDVSVKFGLPIREAFDSNLLESGGQPLEVSADTTSLYMTPFQIRTAMVEIDKRQVPDATE